ncbi:MAG: hypothetical protein ACI83B_002650 [Sediminicola sp.]|jgi:hypothetical protein
MTTVAFMANLNEKNETKPIEPCQTLRNIGDIKINLNQFYLIFRINDIKFLNISTRRK